MEGYKDKFGDLLTPHVLLVKKDTLMACFTLFLSGSEAESERAKLRKRLMDRFEACIQDKSPYLHAAVQAFAKRLHAKNPRLYPTHSAELLYFQNIGNFVCAAEEFISKNRKPGIVTDKYTFCYLVSDVFRIQVHLFQPEEVIINSHASFDYERGYSMYILSLENRFIPLVASIKPRRPSFTPSSGLIVATKEVSTSLFELRVEESQQVVGHFVPPAVKGYKVHRYTFSSTDRLYTIHPIRGKPSDTLYVYHDKTCLTCASKDAKANPYFYLPVLEVCNIYLVVEKSREEADQAIQIETKNGI